MKVAMGADHGGFHLKADLIGFLRGRGYEVTDMGAYDDRPSDYPDFSWAVAKEITEGRAERGILICGSGVGASVAANKVRGIRCSVCHDSFSAHQGVEDDDMNVLSLGARIIGPELAKEIAEIFLKARFSGAERHRRRIGKVKEIEAGLR